MAGKRKISLVLADVDGTLVTEEKILAGRARDAVNARQRAGILCAVTWFADRAAAEAQPLT